VSPPLPPAPTTFRLVPPGSIEGRYVLIGAGVFMAAPATLQVTNCPDDQSEGCKPQ
jgi:hypothetical protein